MRISAEAAAVPSDQALRWLAKLPAEVRPMALARQIPRIVDELARLWPRPGVLAYFDDLLLDRRGGRQGFPPDIYRELVRLQSYRLEQSPSKVVDVWAQSPDVVRNARVIA